ADVLVRTGDLADGALADGEDAGGVTARLTTGFADGKSVAAGCPGGSLLQQADERGADRLLGHAPPRKRTRANNHAVAAGARFDRRLLVAEVAEARRQREQRQVAARAGRQPEQGGIAKAGQGAKAVKPV